MYDLTLEIRGLKSFSQSPQREIHAKCAEVDFILLPLGVLCVHLTLRSLREMNFFTQSETYRVFNGSLRSLRASHSALSARDEFFTQSARRETS
jgi:hypothetical protein